VREAVGLADPVLEAEVVGVIERVAAVEMVGGGLCVGVRDAIPDFDTDPLLVAVRDRVGVRVAVVVGSSVFVPMGLRVAVLLTVGDRVPVGDRLPVRVAVSVRVGTAERVLVEDGIGVRVVEGDRVGVHVARDVADGSGRPARARRLPSTPISAIGYGAAGDPRTPPLSPIPGEKLVRQSKRRSNLILLWYIKGILRLTTVCDQTEGTPVTGVINRLATHYDQLKETPVTGNVSSPAA